MHRIVGSIVSLVQHLATVFTDPEVYRPAACPHCGRAGVWGHGCYHRKADRTNSDEESLNPVPVLRFLCPGCTHTCSRLPACIAPRRWFDWVVQQAVLLLLLGGASLRHCERCSGRDRRTVRRWRDWLQERSESFAFFLRSRFPELGRWADFESFWRHVIEDVSLQQAFACDALVLKRRRTAPAPPGRGPTHFAHCRAGAIAGLIGTSVTNEVFEMMNDIDTMALFRLSVLGPLVSREQLGRGELKQLIREIAQREYSIPGSQRRHIGEKTIEGWYYAWRREGIAGLVPKARVDRGQSRITAPIQEAVLAAKRDNPRRSVRQIVRLLEAAGTVAVASLSRSAVHRLLHTSGLSRLAGSASLPEEKRSFAAEFAGSVWYGDVMHGPRVSVKGIARKTYLVSLIDDASRLVAHSAFCLGETALDIEGVLKQALLRRGVCVKLVVDNGAAYRANTLQGICARLGIHLIFCRPYAPEGKGKLERWHRTVRDQFLSELDERRIADLDDLNARLWAWLEQIYHRTAHAGLGGLTPLARYQRDLPRIRSLGAKAAGLDALFHHRIARHVRKDGTVSYLGARFEVPYELSGKTVRLVVDPHAARVVGVEDEAGNSLGQATALDAIANITRKRRKPEPAAALTQRSGPNLVEIAHAQYHGVAGVDHAANNVIDNAAKKEA